jgi:hypothetical protein
MTGIKHFAKGLASCPAEVWVKTLGTALHSILTHTYTERKREVSFPFFQSINNLELEAGA